MISPGKRFCTPTSVKNKFTCPCDAGKSFFVTLKYIRGTDQDGIVTISGEKYHFDKLPAAGKEYVERLLPIG